MILKKKIINTPNPINNKTPAANAAKAWASSEGVSLLKEDVTILPVLIRVLFYQFSLILSDLFIQRGTGDLEILVAP
jgi:hypothetical protein